MATSSSRPQDNSILGESWVVTSTPSGKGEQVNKEPEAEEASQSYHQVTEENDLNTSQSNSMFESTISGPELIMPSIYEAPLSEASWVAPAVRSRDQPAHVLKRRHKKDSEKQKQEIHDTHDLPTSSTHEPISSSVPKEPANGFLKHATWAMKKLIRAVVNLSLIAGILHMLILPELVHQFRDLCAIGTLSSLYATSCAAVPSYSQPPQPQPELNHDQQQKIASSKYDTVITSQSQLESLFETTLQEMAPYNSTLKQSESMLRDIQAELKQTHPDTKHELELEFDGCWHAVRAAARKFDSLKADIQSAGDSLVAAGGLGSLTSKDGGHVAHSSSGAEVAKDARLSTQMVRREQYLAQLTTRMKSKADSLANDFVTLADHLESIQSVLDRKSKKHIFSSSPESNSPLDGGIGLGLRALVNNIPSLFRAAGDTGSAEAVAASDDSVGARFRDVAGYHIPVAKVVQGLLNRLERLQGRKGV